MKKFCFFLYFLLSPFAVERLLQQLSPERKYGNLFLIFFSHFPLYADTQMKKKKKENKKRKEALSTATCGQGTLTLFVCPSPACLCVSRFLFLSPYFFLCVCVSIVLLLKKGWRRGKKKEGALRTLPECSEVTARVRCEVREKKNTPNLRARDGSHRGTKASDFLNPPIPIGYVESTENRSCAFFFLHYWCPPWCTVRVLVTQCSFPKKKRGEKRKK